CGFFKRHRPQPSSPIVESQNEGRYHVINSHLDDQGEGEVTDDDDDEEDDDVMSYPTTRPADSLPIFVPNVSHLSTSSDVDSPQTCIYHDM
ncbi:unnamed protein product, partial [Didymodactylos carnosus]